MNWINAQMSLPSKSGWYLVLIDTRTEFVPLLGYFTDKGRWLNQLSYEMNPSYWMELPEFPKKEMPYTFGGLV